jgi:hypothetical protein
LDFHGLLGNTRAMARRPWFIALAVALVGLAAGGMLYAQMEGGDRGILPLATSNILEVDGIHVDVGGNDAESARLAGWRIAQRLGFQKLWAQSHGVPINQAPSVPDSTLDNIVSSIVVEREQIGPNRYIADLGVQFDQDRASPLLGTGGITQRSQGMLLFPVMITGGTETSVELRNAWQRAWAEFKTAQSPINYIRVSGLGPDPLLINAAQTERPGRSWWRGLLDIYGADDILIAEAKVHRAYPGGPATATFIGRHGPDGQIVGAFSLSGNDLQALMNTGAERMDKLFADAFAAGQLTRDTTLNPPPPPPPPPPAPTQATQPKPATVYDVTLYALNLPTYNDALAHLRTVPGVDKVQQVNVAIGSISHFLVTYHGSLESLRSVLAARGWGAEILGGNLRIFVRPVQPAAAPRPSAAPTNTVQPVPTAGGPRE